MRRYAMCEVLSAFLTKCLGLFRQSQTTKLCNSWLPIVTQLLYCNFPVFLSNLSMHTLSKTFRVRTLVRLQLSLKINYSCLHILTNTKRLHWSLFLPHDTILARPVPSPGCLTIHSSVHHMRGLCWNS